MRAMQTNVILWPRYHFLDFLLKKHNYNYKSVT